MSPSTDSAGPLDGQPAGASSEVPAGTPTGASPEPGHPAPPARTNLVQAAAWALWDWGSSAYSAVIVTFVFAPYLVKAVAEDPVSGTAALGWASGLAGLVVAVVAPAAGARADAKSRHRRLLTIYTGIVVACVFALAFIKSEPVFFLPGLIFLAAASVFFELAQVSYNAMLGRIAAPNSVGKVSNIGWGFGYLGGLAMLLIALFAFILPEVGLFGAVSEGGWRFRLVAGATAVWFAVWAVPLIFLAPRDASGAQVQTARARSGNPVAEWFTSWKQDYKDLFRRLKDLFQNDRQTFVFFIASAVFRDGLTTIFAVAGVLAASAYGFTETQVIYLGIAANVVAAIGCLVSGPLDDAVGPRAVIITGLTCLCIGAVPILLSDSPTVFWACALFLCLFVGPVNASSRSFLTRITPPERAGENFGLYATTGRAISFLGPWLFSLSITIFGFERAGAAGIIVVLLLGLVLMLAVPRTGPGQKRAEQAAQS